MTDDGKALSEVYDMYSDLAVTDARFGPWPARPGGRHRGNGTKTKGQEQLLEL